MPNKSEKKVRRPWWRKWRLYYLRQFPRRKKLHGTWIHKLLGNRLFDPHLWIPSRSTVAQGAALGMFVGLLPFLGLQIALSIGLSIVFRVNLTAAALATFVTNPLTGPGIFLLQYKLGLWIGGPPDPEQIRMYSGVLKYVMGHGKPFMVGSLVSAVIAGLLCYPITLVAWDTMVKVGKKIPHPHLPPLPHFPKKEEKHNQPKTPQKNPLNTPSS